MNNVTILENFLHDETSNPNTEEFTEIELLIEQYRQNENDVYLRSLAFKLPAVLPSVKNIETLNSWFVTLPNCDARMHIEKRVNECIDQPFLDDSELENVFSLMSQYGSKSEVFSTIETYVLENLKERCSSFSKILQFGTINAYIEKTGSQESQSLLFEIYLKFLKKAEDIETHSDLSEGLSSYNGVLPYFKKAYYKSFLVILNNELENKIGLRRALFLLDLSCSELQRSTSENQTYRKAVSAILDEVERIFIETPSAVRSLKELLSAEGNLIKNKRSKSLSSLTERKKQLVKRIGIVKLLKFLGEHSNNNDVVISERIIFLVNKAPLSQFRTLIGIVNQYSTSDTKFRDVQFHSKNRILELMPEQLSKIKKVEDLKRVTGIEDVAYFSGHPSSFPYLEECLSPLKEKRKELVCAKIELDKGVKSFVSLLPLVHKDAQYFYFEEALLSYLKGLDLQEFTAEYTILQKSVSGNLQSMAYRYISNFLSKRSFDELLTLSKLGTYDKEVAEMITEYKRRRIKEATLSDDWFIQRIKDRRFDGFKPRFRKQAAFLLQGEDVS